MEGTDRARILEAAEEVHEKPDKHPRYLSGHLGPRGGWKLIRIGNLGAAYREGRGCVSAQRDFVFKPLENANAEAAETSGEVWGSEKAFVDPDEAEDRLKLGS